MLRAIVNILMSSEHIVFNINFSEVEMKLKQSPEDYCNEQIKENNSIIDLTKNSESALKIHSPEEYNNPAKTWCSYMERGFRVSRNITGLQIGTHISAPARFTEGGESIENLLPDELAGRFYYIDAVTGFLNVRDMLRAYSGEPFLFIKGNNSVTVLPEEFFMLILKLFPKIWIIAGEFIIEGKPELFFKRSLAMEGKYIIENPDMNAAGAVMGNGHASVRLVSMVDSACAQCRVFVLPDK